MIRTVNVQNAAQKNVVAQMDHVQYNVDLSVQLAVVAAVVLADAPDNLLTTAFKRGL